MVTACKSSRPTAGCELRRRHHAGGGVHTQHPWSLLVQVLLFIFPHRDIAGFTNAMRVCVKSPSPSPSPSRFHPIPLDLPSLTRAHAHTQVWLAAAAAAVVVPAVACFPAPLGPGRPWLLSRWCRTGQVRVCGLAKMRPAVPRLLHL